MARSNADVEAQIAHLRAELLHKEQENERVQAALAREVEERERAERQVRPLPGIRVVGACARGGGARARRAAGAALARD